MSDIVHTYVYINNARPVWLSP